MIERFSAAAGRLYGNLDVFLHPGLANIIAEASRANARVNARVFVLSNAGNQPLHRFLNPRFASCSRHYRLTSILTCHEMLSVTLDSSSIYLLSIYRADLAPFCAGALNCCSVARSRSSNV